MIIAFLKACKYSTPWSEEEHRRFLEGLEKLGKGDWRGISRKFVPTRTSTQVASHAQKHFNRQPNAYRRRKRSSLFDMAPDTVGDQLQAPEQQVNPPLPPAETVNSNSLPSLQLHKDQPKLKPPSPLLNECIPHSSIPLPVVPRFCPAPMPMPMPMPYPFWPPLLISSNQEMKQTHTIIKPTPVVLKERKGPHVIMDMTKLSSGEGMKSRIGPL